MNLSVSNIAWSKKENDKALKLLKKYGISSMEIAPSLLFDDFLHVEDKVVLKTKNDYLKKGFSFVSMQSLLYGAPDCTIFEEEKTDQLFKYLIKDISIANLLGIRNLVFGSPKNRFTENLEDKATKKAKNFFNKLCKLAKKYTINISLEANHRDYGGNFITNTIEAIEFVKKLNLSNFKLNLDLGAILMNNENLGEIIKKGNDIIGHVHISAPFLGEIVNNDIDHGYISKIIKDSGYNGAISLEMKSNGLSSNLEILEKNIKVFIKYYI